MVENGKRKRQAKRVKKEDVEPSGTEEETTNESHKRSKDDEETQNSPTEGEQDAVDPYLLAKHNTLRDLDAFMIKNRVTPDDLASIVNCSKQTLANWVSGQYLNSHDQSITLLLARFLAEEVDFESFHRSKPSRQLQIAACATSVVDKAKRFEEGFQRLREEKWKQSSPKKSPGEPALPPNQRPKFNIEQCMSEQETFVEVMRLCCLFESRKVEKRSLEAYWRAYNALLFGLMKLVQGFEARVKEDEFVLVPLRLLLVCTMCIFDHLTIFQRYHSTIGPELFTRVCLAWRKALLTVATMRPIDAYAKIQQTPSMESNKNSSKKEDAAKQVNGGEESPKEDKDGQPAVVTSPSWLSLQQILVALDDCMAHVECHYATELGWSFSFFEERAEPIRMWFDHFLC